MADDKVKTKAISSLPNSISGDGSTFVAKLKKALAEFGLSVDNEIEKVVDEGGTKPSQVTSVTLAEQHSTDSLGYPKNDILVAWNSGDVTNYQSAQIWTKTGQGEDFEYQGISNTNTYIINAVTANKTYTVKVVAVAVNGQSSEFDNAPIANITIQGSGIMPTTPSQFTVTWEGGNPEWKWLSVNDQDYFDSYELRENVNVSKYEGMIDSTSALYSNEVPSQRSGTAYLFVRNVFGGYSTPLEHQYNKATPVKPTIPTVQELLRGVDITMQEIPTDSIGVEVSATKDEIEKLFKSENNVFTLFFPNGSYDIKYRFYDCFGGGEWSDVISTTIVNQLDENWIADNAITSDKINANAVTSDKIIAGAITTEKIGAGQVTAEKLFAGQITLSEFLTVVGGAVKLSNEGLRLTGGDGSYTLFNQSGINYFDVNGVAYAQVKKMIIGSAQNGKYIRFSAPWSKAPSVMLSPMTMQVNSINYPSANVQIVCEPTEVSTSGFRVNCYSCLQGGSYGTLSPNISQAMTNGNPNMTSRTYQPYNGDGYKNIYLLTGYKDFTLSGFPSNAETIAIDYAIAHSGCSTGFGSPPANVPSQYVAFQVIHPNGTLLSNQQFTMGYNGANGFSFEKSSTATATVGGITYVTVRIAFAFLVKSGDNSSERVLDFFNIYKAAVWAHQPLDDAIFNTQLTIPNVKYSVSPNSIIATGSAMFVVTDGSTNTYTVE